MIFLQFSDRDYCSLNENDTDSDRHQAIPTEKKDFDSYNTLKKKLISLRQKNNKNSLQRMYSKTCVKGPLKNR